MKWSGVRGQGSGPNAECGMRNAESIRNPQSAIRNRGFRIPHSPFRIPGVFLAALALLGGARPKEDCVLGTYDVRDLVTPALRSDATALGVSEKVDEGAARGFALRGTPGGAATQPAGAARRVTQAIEAELLHFIRGEVGEKSWAPQGDGRAVIHEGLLCVWHTRAAHARIAAWLARFRRRAHAQIAIRTGLYVCTNAAVDRVWTALRVNELKPVNLLLPPDAPPMKAALLTPDQTGLAVRLLNTVSGSRTVFSGTLPCLPAHEAALEDVRQVVFVSRAQVGAAGVTAEPGVASSGATLRLQPVPSADLERVQLGVSASAAYLAAIDAAKRPPAAGRDEALDTPQVRTTAIDMTLPLPSGQGVLVSGAPATIADDWGQAHAGQLVCVFWPAVTPRDAPAPARETRPRRAPRTPRSALRGRLPERHHRRGPGAARTDGRPRGGGPPRRRSGPHRAPRPPH